MKTGEENIYMIKKSDSVIINGKSVLRGRVSVQGSKNAALPIIASAILVDDEMVLHNVPDLSDIHVMLEILQHLGASYTFENGVVQLDCRGLENKKIPDELSTKLRASSLLLGPMLARFGECEVGMPGGCTIGSRPLDIHFKGFEKLGAEVYLENGVIRAQTQQLEGDFTLDFRSVGATENLIMAAVFSPSHVILRNIATEPEIMNMIDFLNKAGARIRLTGQATVEIEGVSQLSYCEHQIDPDRIEAATLLIAGVASGGEVTITGAKVEDLKVLLEKLQEMNAKVEIGHDYITVGYQGELVGTTIKTEVHPGFPTDMQSQMCVLMTQASTPSLVIENIFTNRFQHIGELQKMGAKARIEGNVAYIEKSSLTGCRVAGYELRGAASMVMAGILADGVTRVNNLKYLYRGYEAIIEKFQHLGADIAYV